MDKDAGQRAKPVHAPRPHVPLGDRIPPLIDTNEKRKRTSGELLFDATTYGGFALIGNEITATAIVNQSKADNAIGRLYRSVGKMTEKIGPKKSTYIQQGRLNYINFAIIGGMLMVPFIKVLEDNKGKLVRFADRMIHGKHAETEPSMVRAHQEMDEAPKQTWGSLWKGRITTVLAAYTVDATVGWENSLLSRKLAGGRFDRYRSFDHLSERGADLLTPKLQNLVKTPNLHSWTKNGLSLLTLSSTLTLMFYITSKFFAKRHETRRELYDEIHATRAEHVAASEAPKTHAKEDGAPVPTVNAIAHEARVSATPELGREA